LGKNRGAILLSSKKRGRVGLTSGAHGAMDLQIFVAAIDWNVVPAAGWAGTLTELALAVFLEVAVGSWGVGDRSGRLCDGRPRRWE